MAGAVVNASPGLEKTVTDRHELERVFPALGTVLQSLLRAGRSVQWTKNALVFVPMPVGQDRFDLAAWQRAALTFRAFSAIAFGAAVLMPPGLLPSGRGVIPSGFAILTSHAQILGRTPPCLRQITSAGNDDS